MMVSAIRAEIGFDKQCGMQHIQYSEAETRRPPAPHHHTSSPYDAGRKRHPTSPCSESRKIARLRGYFYVFAIKRSIRPSNDEMTRADGKKMPDCTAGHRNYRCCLLLDYFSAALVISAV
jgi:hypothetical protein